MKGSIIPVSDITETQTIAMYALMAEFYERTDEEVFRRDLADKDYCLLLHDDRETIVGFTTQKLLTLEVDGKSVHGMFSGDTIIHRDYWGETELFRVWAQFWFPFAEQYEEFYWFLICKGYKTYRILPLFWETFYPTFRRETPEREQAIMDAYAAALYPGDYDKQSGVITYRHAKDRLRRGVADVDAHRLRNKDIAYFCAQNPHHAEGSDLVCLAKISRDVLKKRTLGILGI